MKKNWYEIKEYSAGEKRLKLTWFIYKLFGRKPVEWIAWWVGTITYLSSESLRYYSRKYFEILFAYTSLPEHKPSIKNSLKHIHNYAESLVDKAEVYSGKSQPDFEQNNPDLKKDLMKNGLFFIFTHIGNIELMRAFLMRQNHKKVHIFMQKAHCEKFNSFINSISCHEDLTIYPVEDIGITTAIEIKKGIDNGDIVFMAGDRLSAQNSEKYYTENILNRKVRLPLGTLKFALMMNCPVYLISCQKTGRNKFKIVSEKFTKESGRNVSLGNLKNRLREFLEKNILACPYQFYHFYDFFE